MNCIPFNLSTFISKIHWFLLCFLTPFNLNFQKTMAAKVITATYGGLLFGLVDLGCKLICNLCIFLNSRNWKSIWRAIIACRANNSSLDAAVWDNLNLQRINLFGCFLCACCRWGWQNTWIFREILDLLLICWNLPITLFPLDHWRIDIQPRWHGLCVGCSWREYISIRSILLWRILRTGKSRSYVDNIFLWRRK